MATFELWNMESGNLLGAFSSEAEALSAVRDAVQRNGQGYGDMLALGRESSRGGSKIMARGGELVEWAAQQAQSTVPPGGHRRARTT